jgi:uncharacterized protein
MSKSPIVQRNMALELLKVFKQYPIISVTGPRQSGKTTICRLLGPMFSYVNLEMKANRDFAIANPVEFLELYAEKAILDEIQTVPDIFSYLQVITDERNKNGQYILSGSQNFLLLEKISQSLAGRVAIFSLLPLSLKELKPSINVDKVNWIDLCFRGFYPRLFANRKMREAIFYKSYVNTYIQKDVRTILNIKNDKLFKKFISLCATRVGTVFNATEIGKLIGVDNKTINSWLSVLESSYIIYTLPAYYNNLEKRILKKPKIYFFDTGLLCYLLGIKSARELVTHALYGSIFENFIINDTKKDYYNKGEEVEMYFWQDSNGNEIDLLIEKASTLHCYEIKASELVKPDFLKQLTKFKLLVKDKKVKTNLVNAGLLTYKHTNHQVISWKHLFDKTL